LNLGVSKCSIKNYLGRVFWANAIAGLERLGGDYLGTEILYGRSDRLRAGQSKEKGFAWLVSPRHSASDFIGSTGIGWAFWLLVDLKS